MDSSPSPRPRAAGQHELNFGDSTSSDGLARWRQQREDAVRALALELGLPLGRTVEVWLKDGIELHGTLRLRESLLFLDNVQESSLEFEIGRATFRYSDIQSCVRSD